MNKWTGIGNLTRDPELSSTSNGTAVCKFSIAVNRNFTNADGERECDFINIVAWRQLAELCSQYLSKGKKVCVVGRLQIRNYETDKGKRQSVTEIIADEVEFLSSKEDEGERGNDRGSRSSEHGERRRPVAYDDNYGDIPF